MNKSRPGAHRTDETHRKGGSRAMGFAAMDPAKGAEIRLRAQIARYGTPKKTSAQPASAATT